MTYIRTQKALEFSQSALTKVVVYFKNEEKRKYFSRDHLRGSQNPNKELGIFRIVKMVNKFYESSSRGGVIRAIVYDNTTDQKIMVFENGVWQ